MENKIEMNAQDMEQVSGGTGGSRKPLPPKAGMVVYQIQRGDTLNKLARRFQTTVAKIHAANPTIHNINDITAGFYIYIPQ